MKETGDPTRDLFTPKSITDYVPQARLQRAEDLLSKLPGLQWNQKGHIVLDGNHIRGSNIKMSLVFFIEKDRKGKNFLLTVYPKVPRKCLMPSLIIIFSIW